MKAKFLQIAVMTAMMSVTTIANAQNYEIVFGSGSTDIVDSIQVDYVTKGATMPYRTSTVNVDAWKTEISLLGMTVDNISATTKWFVDANEEATGEAIKIKWNTEGEYILEARTDITIGGLSNCGASVSAKTVYVLPTPDFRITDGDKAILACDVTSHTVKYKVAGIGRKQVKYTITKKPVQQTGTSAQTDVAVGSAENSTGAFENTVDFATATAKYNCDNVGDEQSITVDNLESGYIYTITLDEVSDQITRKSSVTHEPNLRVCAFTVTPKPTSTKIQHLKNIE